MYKFNLRVFYPAILLFILIFAFSHKFFYLPPLGKFLDPFVGIIQNENESDLNSVIINKPLIGLSDSATVFFDNRKVPHIYAKSDADMYFLQGYVTARLRLWQMDFLSFASAGRLSEIFGTPEMLKYDRNQRRLGLLAAARVSLKMIENEPETNIALTSYTKGVNAYIRSLKYKDFPMEYKLLDYSPELWSNLKSVLVLKQMGNTLSGYEEDMMMSKLILLLGASDFNKLYPDFHNHITPVMDSITGSKASYNTIVPPKYLNYSFISGKSVLSPSPYNPKLGSNSWVVSGEKTVSGSPILANDPHLSLSLPSVWFEMQLCSPSTNVYGVALPGAPAIIIGFNKDVAWGITNGMDDVKDWFKLKISSDYKKYEVDGHWINLKYNIEEIKRKDQNPFYDTVFNTTFGPIVYNKSFPGPQPEINDYALQWELHKPSNEFLTFIRLNKAHNYSDYTNAIVNYHCPTLNFSFACSDNTIAINHQGNMAIKFGGQGKFIEDGTKINRIKTRYIPEDSLPHLLNPKCQFVLSANQHPTYPNFPYYYNGYYTETRANEIKRNLLKKSRFDIFDMMRFQLDNTNSFAVDALPVMQKFIDVGSLSSSQREIFKQIKLWKGSYNLHDKYAEFFDLWWNNIKKLTWDEIDNYQDNLKQPDDYVLLNLLLEDPSNKYFDLISTAKREDAKDITSIAFVLASKTFSEYEHQGYKEWGDVNKVSIMHLANIEGFSRINLPDGGNPNAINATSGDWGPSWRMVVELGKRPRAYGILPGGESGNVGSFFYDNAINNWIKGNYYKLEYFLTAKEAKLNTHCSWLLKPIN